MKSRDKIGLFGGSFDPIHNGHLILAQTAMEYAGLEHVYFIPTAFPPHKRTAVIAGFEDRLKMVELAITDNTRFEISLLEKKDDVSFTWESVMHFKDKGYDRKHVHLLIGGDSLREITRWRRPDLIFENSTIVAMKRPEYSMDCNLPREAAVIVFSEGANDISSTLVRSTVGEGGSIRNLVPDRVEQYISEKSIYLVQGEETK
ncbi:MAG: nicotinate-nucleotide adenylyltransferase [Bacteroidales bacterium]|nr:nicotinate-nucleotide adenylyltransferase [Candidatus Latescibacterota bacterium]